MRYANLIEPYLYGHLTPEEEVVFERQLARDPALAEEIAKRFEKIQTYPPLSENPPSDGKKSSSSKKVIVTGVAAILLVSALLWFVSKALDEKVEAQNIEMEQPIPQAKEVNYQE